MAPTTLNGFWGKPTATLDWCERNYEVTYYIAEFWNTLSNLAMLLPAIWGGWQAWKDGLELRFLLSHFFLLVVGCGSWWFHMTLQYGMQLFDELPMVWGSLILVYALAEVNSPPKKRNVPLIIGLILYGLIVTIIYLTIKQPLFHQVAYGFLVATTFFMDIILARNHPCEIRLFLASTIFYLTGFLLWNMDNILCSKLISARKLLPRPLQPFTQLHAWWHCLAGYGSYIHILYCCHARLQYLKRECIMKISWKGLTMESNIRRK